MTASVDSSFEFTNLNSLASLKSETDSPEVRRAVAQQFESLFLNLMIKQMRSASAFEGGLIDQRNMEQHQSMLDQQLALTLSQRGGIGLADSILRSLGGDGSPAPPRSSAAPSLYIRSTTDSARPAPVPQPVEAPRASPPAFDELAAGSPREFVGAIWPLAENAARALGTVPEIIVAQAALETGWGRSLPRNHNGQSSLNLFGIKAGSGWEGPRAVVSTLEFVDGLPERQRLPFRMYASLNESFDDYVRLVGGKPRYAEAVGQTSPEAYARALQRAGYATDPEYAEKLIAIVNRGLPGRESTASLENAGVSRVGDTQATGVPALLNQVLLASADTHIAAEFANNDAEGNGL